VLSFVEVFRGVLVLGRVATPHMPARQAQAQVNPFIAGLNAVLTDMFVGFRDFDLVQVSAFRWHRFLRESSF
jgi:hypothetical protein